MWDQLIFRNIRCLDFRIIPTYVGSTSEGHPGISQRSNHSHVCGINAFDAINSLCTFESFPRMWDQLRSAGCPAVPSRIIPTYVGSTLAAQPVAARPANHSHVCGINIDLLHNIYRFLESFPRMWDQLSFSSISFMFLRIIPTYVGSTSIPRGEMRELPNHSHVCGINPSSRCRPG